jgi:hypothetical protein
MVFCEEYLQKFCFECWTQKCCICLHGNVTTLYQAKWNLKCIWRPAYKYRALIIKFSELECMKCSTIPVFWNIMLCMLICRYPCLEEHIVGIFSTAQVTHLGLENAGSMLLQLLFPIYHSMWCHIIKDRNVHQHCCENLISQIWGFFLIDDTSRRKCIPKSSSV